MHAEPRARPSAGAAFALGDFRRLFAGITTSQRGDPFALVAAPRLILQRTGDPFAPGMVLALQGGPRAAIMRLGGAVTDRFPPRPVMSVCAGSRLVLAVTVWWAGQPALRTIGEGVTATFAARRAQAEAAPAPLGPPVRGPGHHPPVEKGQTPMFREPWRAHRSPGPWTLPHRGPDHAAPPGQFTPARRDRR